MTDLKNKEKMIRDLVDTFKDRNDLHTAYKDKMVLILLDYFYHLIGFMEVNPDVSEFDVASFTTNYVETNCRKE